MSESSPAGSPGPPGPSGPAKPARTVKGVLLLVAAIVVVATGAVTVLGFFGRELGVDALAVGIAAAVIPVPVLVLVFLWLDRYDPGPVRFMIFCFGWGAFVATAIALGVNTLAANLMADAGLPEGLVAVVVAPVIEELGKTAAPLLLWLARRRSIHGITDGIVYCGLSATGFAMVENILYLGGLGYRAGLDEFGPATGMLMLISTFVGRVFLSGFAHPLFTAAAGVGIGTAVRSTSTAVRWGAVIAGLLVAMLLHAMWNLMATLTAVTGQFIVFLYGYVAVMVPIFLAMAGLVLWIRAREGQITQRTLPDYVRAGWLSPPEVAALRNLGTRHSARRWARRVAGEAGGKAMRRFQLSATRLALLRERVVRGLEPATGDGSGAAAEEAALLAEIHAHRAAFVGRDPAVPPARWDGQRYEVTFPDGVVRWVSPPPEPAMPLPVGLAPPPPAFWHIPPGYR